jgi:hypothetical protein
VRVYTGACFSCAFAEWDRRKEFATEEQRSDWMERHRGHRVMVGEADEPDPQPIARVRHEDVGNPDSPDWRHLAAIVSRTRTMRLEHATWCMDHADLLTPEQLETIRGIIDGAGDPILQKCMEHGIDPE